MPKEDRSQDILKEVPAKMYGDYFRDFNSAFQQVSDEDGVAATGILQTEKGKRTILFQKALIGTTSRLRFCILSTGLVGPMPAGVRLGDVLVSRRQGLVRYTISSHRS